MIDDCIITQKPVWTRQKKAPTKIHRNPNKASLEIELHSFGGKKMATLEKSLQLLSKFVDFWHTTFSFTSGNSKCKKMTKNGTHYTSVMFINREIT